MGCADRSAYDLSQHTKATGIRLAAEKKLAEPKVVDVVEVVPNKAAIGKSFKKEAKIITETLSDLTAGDIENIEKQFEAGGYVDLLLMYTYLS